MVASREVHYWKDFSGGLNLTNQTQNLEENESPDTLNMDFGLRGGVVLRGGFRTQKTDAELASARFLGQGDIPSGSNRLFIQTLTSQLYSWDGSTLTDTSYELSDDDTERVRMAVFNNYGYFANGRSGGVIEMRSWNGTTFRTLPNAFNDTYASPAAQGAGNMPKGRYIVEHMGFIWVADTVESAVRYPGRVRFSHEQNPENFATADWFNVGDPGDPITSLVPFGDMLMVFKRDSVWAIYGYDKDSWVLERITDASGTCTCGAIAVNSGVAYWFSTDGQLMAFNGRSVAVLSEPIRWWSDTGKIKHGGSHRLMWSDGRLWMSLEAGSSQPVTRWLFVWDPSTKTFTRYDRVVTDLFSWSKTGSDADPLFFEGTATDLMRYDRSYNTDITTAGGEDPVRGYFRTAWFSAGETASLKRFKRPRVTAAGDANATVKVDVYMDFDDLTSTRTQTFTISVPTDASLWGTMDWGDNWYVQADEYYSFAQIGSSGTGYAVSYKFSSDDNLGRWWVDSITIPFRRKSVR